MGAAHLKGQPAGEAQAAHQDDGGDDQVAGVGEVHPVLHHVAHTDGGDHAVEDEGHAAHDGRRHGVDQRREHGAEGQRQGVDGGQPDHPGVVHLGEDQHTGILAVGGVGGAAEDGGQGGGDAVADEGAVQAGLLNEVLPHGGGDGGHVADVLHHGGDGDGSHHQDGGEVKLGDGAAEVGEEGLEADGAGGGHGGEVHQGDHRAGGVQRRGAQGVGDDRHQVGAHHAQQDGDDLDHAAAPDVGRHDDGHGHQRQPPAGLGVIDGGGGQVQSDEDDDGAGDHGGEEAHDLLHAHRLDDQGQRHIQQAGHHDAAAGVLQLFRCLHGGVFAGVQLRHCLKPAQEGEGGAQESGHPQPGAHVEEQRAHPREKQGGLDGQGQSVIVYQDGHQHRGAEHGEHVLKAQDEHLRHTQGAGVADGLLVIHTRLSLT